MTEYTPLILSLESQMQNPLPLPFSLSGGTLDPEHLPVAAFRGEGGLVGCVSDLTLGAMLELDLPGAADDGRNIEECSRAFQ